jgi:hypothetical protein
MLSTAEVLASSLGTDLPGSMVSVRTPVAIANGRGPCMSGVYSESVSLDLRTIAILAIIMVAVVVTLVAVGAL